MSISVDCVGEMRAPISRVGKNVRAIALCWGKDSKRRTFKFIYNKKLYKINMKKKNELFGNLMR